MTGNIDCAIASILRAASGMWSLRNGMVIPLLLALALGPMNISGAGWLVTETVQYQENHDPWMVWLVDGRKLQVEYTNIEWEEVEQWAKGRKLKIAFSKQTGAVLVDDDSGRHIPITSGLNPHPLDRLLKRKLDRAISTVDMVAAHREIDCYWQAEIERAYRVLESTLPAELRASVKDARKAWGAFRKKQVDLLGKMYAARDGTMWRIVLASRVRELDAHHAKALVMMKDW